MTRTRAAGYLAWTVAVSIAANPGCKCDKETEAETEAAPALGQANSKELMTNLGSARGLEGIASTATKWSHFFSIDADQLVIAGHYEGKSVAIATSDQGESWRALDAQRKDWSAWTYSMDSDVVLATGSRAQGARDNQLGPIDDAIVHFTKADAIRIGAPSPVFPVVDGGTFKPPLLGPPDGSSGAMPGILSSGLAAFIGTDARRRPVIQYAVALGAQMPDPVPWPPGETPAVTPYGHPPSAAFTKGRALFVRPIPAPGQPMGAPVPVSGITLTSTLITELSRPPACEFGAWSFQKVSQPGGKLWVVGISPDRTVTIELPAGTDPETTLGCDDKHVVVEVLDKEAGRRKAARCTLEGECTLSKNYPFREWDEEYERVAYAVPTADGAILAASLQNNDRWAVYVSHSSDGIAYEIQRPVGEGEGDRGRYELGALTRMGDRVVLLLAANVTGRSKRAWYVIVSDDGGSTWNPP